MSGMDPRVTPLKSDLKVNPQVRSLTLDAPDYIPEPNLRNHPGPDPNRQILEPNLKSEPGSHPLTPVLKVYRTIPL